MVRQLLLLLRLEVNYLGSGHASASHCISYSMAGVVTGHPGHMPPYLTLARRQMYL